MRRAGRVLNFVKVDSAATEVLWKELEDKLHDAFTHLDQGDLLDYPDHVATIKQAIALHFARSHETLEMSKRLWSQVLTSRREVYRAEPRLLQLALDHRYHGLTVISHDAEELALDELTATRSVS